MRILWVKAGKLLPVDTGGKIRSYNILRGLQQQNEVTLFSYYSGSRDDEYERLLIESFPKSLTLHTGIPEVSALDYLRRVTNPAPYAVTKFTSKEVRNNVASLLANGEFDVAVCDFLAASLNFPEALPIPTVLFQHNVESSLWRRQAQHESNTIKRLAFALEAAKMARYERRTVARFDHVIAVSENDRELMGSMTDKENITVVPTGVDLGQFNRAHHYLNSSSEPVVIFVGSMDWEANIDAMDYFCREIWPSVRGSVPQARLRIVGRNPHPKIKKLEGESIEVTGTVPSVVEHYREAAVNIVPLRVGGGTRLKIYEAMAMGKATVSTSIGAEGLDVNDGVDIMIADSASTFADGVIKLLQDRNRREALGNAAAQQAARYDWPVISKRFERVLMRIAQLPERSGWEADCVDMASGSIGARLS